MLSWRWKFLLFFLRLEGFCRNKIFQKWFLETRQVRKSAALFLLRRWKRKRESNFIFLEKNCFLRHEAKNERAGFPSLWPPTLNPWENLGWFEWLTSEPAIGSLWFESTQNNGVGFVADKGFFEALMGTALFLNIRQKEFWGAVGRGDASDSGFPQFESPPTRTILYSTAVESELLPKRWHLGINLSLWWWWWPGISKVATQQSCLQLQAS